MNAKKAKKMRQAVRWALENDVPVDPEALTKAGRRAVAMARRKIAKGRTVAMNPGVEGTP